MRCRLFSLHYNLSSAHDIQSLFNVDVNVDFAAQQVVVTVVGHGITFVARYALQVLAEVEDELTDTTAATSLRIASREAVLQLEVGAAGVDVERGHALGPRIVERIGRSRRS